MCYSYSYRRSVGTTADVFLATHDIITIIAEKKLEYEYHKTTHIEERATKRAHLIV
jgi:hypothetical protein